MPSKTNSRKGGTSSQARLARPTAARLGYDHARCLGALWPDRDESTRATIEADFAARAELNRNADDAR